MFAYSDRSLAGSQFSLKLGVVAFHFASTEGCPP